MPDPLLTPAAKGDWAVLLDRIDASIRHALETTAEQEKSFAVHVGAASADPKSLTDHLDGLRSKLEASSRLAESVEALLVADEQEARAWADLAGRARARLASPPTGRLS
ncbi:MAG TPA: hypothetical protein VH120_00685 [Gemmataceae bacterium]|jgi:hypothetical protein|nr:hypothetical protein [Gemmataceae bacterium]